LQEEGNKAFKDGRYADAAKAFTIAMQLNPDEKSFYGNRSAAFSKLGQVCVCVCVCVCVRACARAGGVATNAPSLRHSRLALTSHHS
jgi:hypothetical protein